MPLQTQGHTHHSTVVQECILAGTNAIYDFSYFVIKTIISRYFGILRICEFHLPLNQTLFYTCTDVPNLTYHDFYKIHIKFRINVKYCILFLNKLNCYAVLETGPDIIVFSIGYQFCHFLLMTLLLCFFLERRFF